MYVSLAVRLYVRLSCLSFAKLQEIRLYSFLPAQSECLSVWFMYSSSALRILRFVFLWFIFVYILLCPMIRLLWRFRIHQLI